MTPTEQVRAVLESKGWTQIKNHNTMACDGIWKGYPPKGVIIGHPVPLPDLLHSLDACHEVFEKDAPDSYWNQLSNVVLKVNWISTEGSFALMWLPLVCKATCAQRIEAYLRDIGKWKE